MPFAPFIDDLPLKDVGVGILENRDFSPLKEKLALDLGAGGSLLGPVVDWSS